MTYQYVCEHCSVCFEVSKKVDQRFGQEFCPMCNHTGKRILFPQHTYLNGTSVQEAEFNPAFGKVIKNKRHRNELAKEKGMMEIGNTSTDSMQKHCDQIMCQNQSWDNIDV